MNALPRLLWAWMLTLLLACQAHAQGQFKPVPQLRARVTDEIGMLTPDQRERLEAVLADYEKNKGSQIAVLIVSSTEPEAIEQYSIRVTDAWKLGRKGVDDGVLLLVAKDNPKALRRLRIEAGRGVQGVLTDAQSKRILEDTIAPHFRQQDWYGGLAAGVGAIAAVLNQEKFPEPQQQAPTQQDDDGGPGIIVTIFMLVAGFALLRSFFRRAGTRLAQPGRRGQNNPNWDHGWSSGATGFILGSILSNAAHAQDDDLRRGGGFSGGFSDGGGFSGGGGGTFDGGGASGDW